MKFITLIILIFLFLPITAQNAVSGRVVDERNRQPMAFVNIIVNENPRLGIVTDIDGNFSFSGVRVQSLTFTFVGFERKTVNLDTVRNPQRMVVPLQHTGLTLGEVTIDAGENPADRIIREVIANRRINNPENISSFRYRTHNKIIVDLIASNRFGSAVFDMEDSVVSRRYQVQYGDTVVWRREVRDDDSVVSSSVQKRVLQNSAIKTINIRDEDTTSELTILLQRIDHTEDSIVKLLLGGVMHLMISETVTERQFLYPNRSQETILGTRISGFQTIPLPFSATDFQPFSFYQDHIPLMGTNFLNPISTGSLNNYFFHIEDTIFQGQDTVFVLSFRPRRGRNFDGLTGILQINTNRFAVQHVIAQPAEQNRFWNMRIEQNYLFLSDTQWFPAQLNFDIWINPPRPATYDTTINFFLTTDGMPFMSVRSFIDSVELFVDLHRRDFSTDQVIVNEDVLLQDSAFWAERRIVPLTEAQLTTYRLIDSLSEIYGVEEIFTAVWKILQGNVPLSIFDFDILQTLVYNRFEGVRLGLGVSTNERLSRNFSIGGFFGYGLRDNLWKYGGEFRWTINRRHDVDLRIGYQYTLRETGSPTLLINPLPGQEVVINNFRAYLASQMDRIERKNVDVGFRMFRYARFNVGLSRTRVQPLYDYAFFSELHNENFVNFNYTSLNIGLRYSHRERFVRTPSGRRSLGTRNPVFFVNYSRGLRGFLDGDFDFNKVEFRMDHSFLWRTFGETNIRVGAGWVDRPLPYGLLFTGEGSISSQWGIFVPNYFQTMRNYEFLSDQYAHLFFSHNFGAFFRVGNWRPHFIVHQNMGWGRLSNPERHQDITFRTKDNGFLESGLHIDRLFRINLALIHVNFGVGAFFRYGANAFDRTRDNFHFKFSMNFSAW